jgi:hypothetical protein
MLSLIKNPNLLYRLSENDEKDGNIDAAILDIQAAIGILETHNLVTGPVYSKYNKRLEELQKFKLQTKLHLKEQVSE